MAWNWLDAALIGMVTLSVVAAMWEGLIRELLSLGSFIAGVVIAALEYPRAATLFRGATPSPEVAMGLGFLALFFTTLVAGAVFSFLLRRVVQKAGLAWFDRFLGGIFGLVRGFAVCSVLLLAMVSFSIQAAVVQSSSLAPYILMGTRIVATVMPKDLKAKFQSGLEKFKKGLVEMDRKSLGK